MAFSLLDRLLAMADDSWTPKPRDDSQYLAPKNPKQTPPKSIDSGERRPQQNRSTGGELFTPLSGKEASKNPLGAALTKPRMPDNPMAIPLIEKVQGVEEQKNQAAQLQDARDVYGRELQTGYDKFETQEMTWDDYNALPPRQRAAVQANTAIAQAVAADKAALEKGTLAERDEEYERLVNSLFGPGGDSETYAPRTLAVLEKLGMTNQTSSSLDQYLNLSGLLTDEDIAGLTDANIAAADSLSARGSNAVAFSQYATEALGETLSRGQDLLTAARSNPMFGEDPPMGNPAFNALDPQQEDSLNDFFQALATGDVEDHRLPDYFAYFSETYGLSPDSLANFMVDKLDSYDFSTPAAERDPAMMSRSQFINRYFPREG